MKEVKTSDIKYVLRELGLRKRRQGNATGHEVWLTKDNLRVNPHLIKPTVNINLLFSLATHLDQIGVCNKREFIAKVKGGRNG